MDVDTSIQAGHDESYDSFPGMPLRFNLITFIEYTVDVSVGPYSSIPAESEVRAAREKRERLRARDAVTGGSEDFVSLTVSKSDSSKASESRLVREEDEYGEGDEGKSRAWGRR